MDKLDLKNIGPIQLLAVAFRKPVFKGKINDELQKLRDEKMVKIIDGVAIQKTESGEIKTLEASDLTATESMEFGAVIGGFIGLGSGSTTTAMQTSEEMAEKFHKRYEYGLDKEDIEDMAEGIPKGDAALILLIEHRWLIPLRNAMRDAGGILLAQDFLSPELLMTLGKQQASLSAA